GLGVRPHRRHHRGDQRRPARHDPAGEPCDRGSRHRQPRLPRHRLRHRQGLRHQGAGGGLDPGGEFGRRARLAVFRHGEPGEADRGAGGGQVRRL
ncbi:MAG: Acyl carrier protein, partial [uncultured Craurococcus sp.]